MIGDADVGAHDSGMPRSLSKCGEKARLLVDFFAAVPKAEAAQILSVQSPSIAVNASDLYFLLNWDDTRGRNGCLMRRPFGADRVSCVVSIPGGGSSATQSIIATDSAVIYGRAPLRGQIVGGIDRFEEREGRVDVLSETNGDPMGLVADSNKIFFTDNDGTKSIGVDGGELHTLATAKAYSLGLIGSTLYMGGGSLTSVAVDGGSISVLDADPALYPLACGDAVCWIAGAPLVSRLAQLGQDGWRRTLASDVTQAHALVSDGTNFFVTVGAVGLSLLRVPAAGGSSFLVATEPATSLALDDDCLYWAGAAGIFDISRAVADVADVH
jgi:hypothetical protein